MLKLWITSDFKSHSGLVLMNPDGYFDMCFDYQLLESDFSKRVLKDCSGGLEVINYATLKRPNDMLISPREIGSGSKNLLCMKYEGNSEGHIYNMLWCGDNCNKYVAEIASETDLELFSGRVYNPFIDISIPDLKVKIMELDKIVTNARDFTVSVVDADLWKRLKNEPW